MQKVKEFFIQQKVEKKLKKKVEYNLDNLNSVDKIIKIKNKQNLN